MAAVRQKIHLSGCSNSPGQLCRDYFDAYARKFDRKTTSIAAFRLALFTLRWVNGFGSRTMDQALIPTFNRERSTKRFMGKPRFFELISYGLSFLGTLVRTEHDRVRVGNARTSLRLRRLAECTKWGFPPRAIPFAELVSRSTTRLAAIATYKELDSFAPILGYAGDSSPFNEHFPKSKIYEVFSGHYQEAVAQLASAWAERGRSNDDEVMGNLSEMWGEFESRFKTICLRENAGERPTSLRLTLRALFRGLDFKLDCASLGYGPTTAIVRPTLQIIEDGMLISYYLDIEDKERRLECLVIFADLKEGEVCNLSGERIHTSEIASLKPDNIWVVLIEPPFEDCSIVFEGFVSRARMSQDKVRFLALDAYLIFLASLIRGFVDSPQILFDNDALSTELFQVKDMPECFNDSIVSPLQAATLAYDSVWDTD